MSQQETTDKYFLLPWIMWGFGALFYCYEFFLQVSPSVMVPDLMRAFHVSGAQLGNLGAFYFYAYAPMQIPVGVLLDRFGTRRLLTVASLVCATGCVIFGTAHYFALACLGRLLIGAGSAFAAVSCLHIAATWLPIRRFALMTGVLLTMGTLGAIGGQAPLSLLVGHIGWRHSMLLFGGVGLALALLIYVIVRDRRMRVYGTEVEVKHMSLLKGLKVVIRNRQSWICAIYGGLMFAPTSAFGALWGVPFLMRSYHLSRPSAAFLVSFLFVGWAIGAPLFGWISDRMGRRKPTLYIGSLGALICLASVIYLPLPSNVAVGIGLFGFGFFSGGFLPTFSVMRENNPPETNATSLGFMNMFNMLGGALMQPLIGRILDMNWQGELVSDARVYSVDAYHIAMMVIPIGMALSLLILPFMKETYCKPVVPATTR